MNRGKRPLFTGARVKWYSQVRIQGVLRSSRRRENVPTPGHSPAWSRSVAYGAVSRSMRSTSSRGMWMAPANLSALSTPRSTISWTSPGVRSRYSAASHKVTCLRFLSSILQTSLPGKGFSKQPFQVLGCIGGPPSRSFPPSVLATPALRRARRSTPWPSSPCRPRSRSPGRRRCAGRRNRGLAS